MGVTGAGNAKRWTIQVTHGTKTSALFGYQIKAKVPAVAFGNTLAENAFPKTCEVFRPCALVRGAPQKCGAKVIGARQELCGSCYVSTRLAHHVQRVHSPRDHIKVLCNAPSSADEI